MEHLRETSTRPMLRTFFVLLVLISLFPAGSLRAQVSRRSSDPAEAQAVMETALRWLVENLDRPPPGEVSSACLLVFEEEENFDRSKRVLGPEVEALEGFLTTSLDLSARPIGVCRTRDPSAKFYTDSETGHRAAVLRLSRPKFIRPTEAWVLMGFHLGPLWGSGRNCKLLHGEDGWAVSACTVRWQS